MLDVPRHPVVHRHPLHAMLSDLPIGLLPAAIASAVVVRRHPEPSRARFISDAVSAMTFAAAAGAAAVGVWDWLTIPRSHPAWWPATIHGAINAGTVAALGAAVSRRGQRLAISAAVAAGFVVTGWLGGDLVFVHGWRVKPAEEYEQVVERLDAAGDAALAEARDVVATFERETTFLAP